MYIHHLRDKLKHRINLVRAKRNLDRYHRLHKQAALIEIENVERHNGQKLTPYMKKKSDEYAVEVFGDKRYAPWLFFYSVLRGKFFEGWIPANFYSRYVLPDNGLIGLAITKTFSKIVLKTDAIPDIAYQINGLLFGKDFLPINLTKLHQLIGKDSSVLLKSNRSLRGRGVKKLHVAEIDEETLRSIGDCVIQNEVKQHPFFDEIVIGPLSAIRIVTVRNFQGNIEYRGAYLKLGRQGYKLYHSDDGFFIPVIKKDGRLGKFCYDDNFKRMTKHPDTNYSFENKYLPKFPEVVGFCIKLHGTIPHFPIVGWDMAVDREEDIKVLEWNAGIPHPEIKLLEGTIGPCFMGLNWELLKND